MMNAARLAIVTGGSRGIGAAIVEKLLEMDYQLIVTGKQARESRKGVEYYAVDFSDRDATERFVQMMAARSVDVLVNNAGINQIGSFQEISTDIFDKIQEVNVHAPFRLTQAVIPGMRSRGWGRVVSITSVFSEVSRSFRASYSTSKFGIYGMTTALAAEVARDGVLVNCVAPGFVETELTRNVLGEKGIQEVKATIPIGRLAQPAEIAELVGWLVSEKNSYVSGQNMLIDGGFTRV